MIVGARIKELLAVRGISQAELARRVGVRQSTMNMLANGRSHGSKHLHRIARELGTTPAYLTGETDDPDAENPQIHLSSQEQRLLEIYRQLPTKDRAALKQLITRLVQDETKGR
jgi:transcriptional regulator with XRE-family HTH domain